MKSILILSAAALITATSAQAKGMKWTDATGAGLPAGAKMAVVSGDPSKAGEFTIRIKAPAGFAVPPHHHPSDEVVRVVSGGPLTYGMGDKADASNSGTLEKGYHITMQANMNHWVSMASATEVQVNGTGPFAIIYVNPADDPRNAKK